MTYYLYVETAFHHEGNVEYLLKLIDAAKESGAKGVKFQVLIELDEFMSSKHTVYNEAKNWIISIDNWEKIFKYTKDLGLDIIFMPMDIKAFDLISKFEIKYIEIHSVSFRDEKLLKELDKNNLPLILGIGGRTLVEIENLLEKYSSREIVLMVGFQAYPSDLKDVKLERISEFKKLYPHCQIGYADHSSFDDDMAIHSNEYAYILGARIFEKHITIDEGKERIDFQSAVSVKKISLINEKLNYLDSIFNLNSEFIFDMSIKEVIYRNRQKIPTANRKINESEIIKESMLDFKMIDAESFIEEKDLIIGKRAKKTIEYDEAINIKDI